MNILNFLFENKDYIEDNLEKYKNTFDVVLTNNSGFNDVTELLKI